MATDWPPEIENGSDGAFVSPKTAELLVSPISEKLRLPLLLIVTSCEALALPTFCEPNWSATGATASLPVAAVAAGAAEVIELPPPQ